MARRPWALLAQARADAGTVVVIIIIIVVEVEAVIVIAKIVVVIIVGKRGLRSELVEPGVARSGKRMAGERDRDPDGQQQTRLQQ